MKKEDIDNDFSVDTNDEKPPSGQNTTKKYVILTDTNFDTRNEFCRL